MKKHPFGEADELLTIYTRETGKLRVKSVSSRKIQSRLAGFLQSLNEVEFETAGRRSHSPAAGSALPVLISARARTVNNYLREDLKKFAFALVGIETLYRLTPDREANPEAYESLIRFLKDLGETRDEKYRVRLFQLQLLESSGFSLPVNQCLNCQRPFASAKAYFAPGRGGFFCASCTVLEPSEGAMGEMTILEDRKLRQLHSLLAGQLHAPLYREVDRVIDGFLSYVLEREIKSRGFLQVLNLES